MFTGIKTVYRQLINIDIYFVNIEFFDFFPGFGSLALFHFYKGDI